VGVTEQVVHFLQSASSSFVEKEVEYESIGKAANGEDQVVFPALTLVSVILHAKLLTDIFECLGGYLANGEIGEPRRGSGDTDSFRTNTGLHNLDRAIQSARAEKI
jgi:hypothetical protein